MNNTFEEIFIEHCAPLLAGIKTSNLFSVKYEDYNALYEKIVILTQTLNKKDIYIRIIKKSNSSNSFYLIFAYRKTKFVRWNKLSYLPQYLSIRNLYLHLPR